jgi:hypothetical protein
MEGLDKGGQGPISGCCAIEEVCSLRMVAIHKAKPKKKYKICLIRCFLYCDMTPENRKSGARLDVHC